MPKLRSDAEIIRKAQQGVLSGFSAEKGFHVPAKCLAYYCCTSHKTGLNRYKDPDTLTIKEIRSLKGLSDEDIIRLVRGRT